MEIVKANQRNVNHRWHMARATAADQRQNYNQPRRSSRRQTGAMPQSRHDRTAAQCVALVLAQQHGRIGSPHGQTDMEADGPRGLGKEQVEWVAIENSMHYLHAADTTKTACSSPSATG